MTVTGLYICYTFYYYLSVLYYTYRKKFAVKQYALLCQQQPHTSRVYSGPLMEFSVVLDLTLSFCAVACCTGLLPRSSKLSQSLGV